MAEYAMIIGANSQSAVSAFGDWAVTPEAAITFGVGAVLIILMFKLLSGK